MAAQGNIRHFLRELLPLASPCAREAAALLLGAMLHSFTGVLMELARKTARDTTAKSRRQLFARWLSRPQWDAEQIYAGLNRGARRLLAHRRHVPLLVDITELSDEWAVLQVSVPFEGRALPLYRHVTHVTGPEEDRRTQLREMSAFLRQHLPGNRGRYLLVMDRGFPGHWLIKEWQATPWRFVVRVSGQWKATHPQYTGELRQAPQVAGLVGPRPKLLRQATLGNRDKGAEEWSETNVVFYHGEGYKEPWYLLTSEASAAAAVRLYRERMKIECEFKDLKGPLGLDEVSRWTDRNEVARFLGLVAAYEWRLAYLWLQHGLRQWRKRVEKYGPMSWIRVTREWIAEQMVWAAQPVLAKL